MSAVNPAVQPCEMNRSAPSFVHRSPPAKGKPVSVRHYQLACAVLALTTVASVAVAHQRARTPTRFGAPARGESRTAVERLRRPVRVPASALGVSEAELIDKLLAARTAREVGIYADKLGTVGTDDAVAAMVPLVDDPRAGVPEAVIGAIGHIGTHHATDVLLGLANDLRPRVRTAAIGALGSTPDERAVAALCTFAADRGDPARLTAIWALGEQGGDAAVKQLVAIARAGDGATGPSAVAALAQIPSAQEALLGLVDAPDLRIRVAALGALDPTTPAVVKRLTAVIEAGEPQTSQAAIGALGRSGDTTVVPVLAKAAAQGNSNVRWAVVSALGDLGGSEAIDVLGDLLAHGDLDVENQIATTLANLGDDEARGKLIEVALEGGRRGSAVLAALGTLRGDDIDAALLSIAKDGTASARREALPILLRNGAPAAVGMVNDLIKTGTRADRLAAIAMLGDAPGPEARATLLDVAGREHGPLRNAALDALSQTRPDDPALAQLLGDALLGGRPDEVSQAATILGRVGTPEARQLLVAAIGDDDVARAGAAIGALGYGTAIDGDLRAALVKVATSGPQALRAQATQQLLTAGGSEGVTAARALIGGDDPDAARAAVWSLSNAGSDEADAAIRDALDSKDAGVRGAALQVLAQRPDDADTARLVAMAHDADPSVKAQAMSTLGTIGSPQAIDSLIQSASSGSTDDRVAAINGLGSADDPRVSSTLARYIEDSDPQIAAAAIYASGAGGDDVDQALLRAFRSAPDGDQRRYAAATQIRQRGIDVDDATDKELDGLLGSDYGGSAYGGYGYRDRVDFEE
ncbi:MAG TPA: HEAT repeat domain-containing protein [Kofleriaceae bacterium]|nr:HEAT repeat domain-containing protein [Kofleriaceae bacterium]